MRAGFLTVAATGAVIAFCVMPIHAQPPEDEDYPPSVKLGRWAADLTVGPKMKAAGRDLRGSILVSQDLRGADFTGSDLSYVEFTNCDLSNASFKGAVFADTEFVTCNLNAADFDDATVSGANPDLVGLVTTNAHLSEKQLKSTRSYREKKLTGCTIAATNWDTSKPLVEYDFRGALLMRASLLEGDFSACDFTDAHIDELGLAGARISFKQLASTWNYKSRIPPEKTPRLPKLSLYNRVPFAIPDHQPAISGKVDFRGVNLTGLRINGPPLRDADFTDATITHGTFIGGITKAQLCMTKNYKQGDLSGIEVWHIDLSNVDLSSQNLTDSVLNECDLTGANFRDAIITNMDFAVTSANNRGLTVEQIKSTWNYKHGRMAGVVLPKELAEALQKEKASDKKDVRE